MPGFFVCNQNIDIALRDLYPDRCVAGEISGDRYTIRWSTLNKFLADKAFQQVGEYLVASEGYLLNKKELFQEYSATTVAELAVKMYERDGETFFNAFRGSFSGAFYDKSRDKWLIYTNHTGDNPIFYALFDGGFYAGSQVTYLLDALRKTNHKLHLDEDGAYQILTFGFMERDNSFANEIRRLRGGMYLKVEHGEAEVREYHMFHKHPELWVGGG